MVSGFTYPNSSLGEIQRYRNYKICKFPCADRHILYNKAIVQFYKLINAINHEVIFDWMNVRRLNRIGRNLLISFMLSQAYMITNYWEATRLFELEGYEHNFWCDFQPMTLIMGLIALLVGRIFAIGLQMKEEQELTI